MYTVFFPLSRKHTWAPSVWQGLMQWPLSAGSVSQRSLLTADVLNLGCSLEILESFQRNVSTQPLPQTHRIRLSGWHLSIWIRIRTPGDTPELPGVMPPTWGIGFLLHPDLWLQALRSSLMTSLGFFRIWTQFPYSLPLPARDLTLPQTSLLLPVHLWPWLYLALRVSIF